MSIGGVIFGAMSGGNVQLVLRLKSACVRELRHARLGLGRWVRRVEIGGKGGDGFRALRLVGKGGKRDKHVGWDDVGAGVWDG